jgi:hypothetical protein
VQFDFSVPLTTFNGQRKGDVLATNIVGTGIPFEYIKVNKQNKHQQLKLFLLLKNHVSGLHSISHIVIATT